MNGLHTLEMLLQGANHSQRHRRHAVFVTLPFADGDLAAFEVRANHSLKIPSLAKS